jgi:hypothetical protein
VLSRRSTIFIAVSLCVGSLGAAAVCGVIYAARNVYVRGVSLAVEHRQDAYQAALEGVEALALDFAAVIAGFAFAVFAIGLILLRAGLNRADSPASGVGRVGG